MEQGKKIDAEQNRGLINQSLTDRKAIFDDDRKTWDILLGEVLADKPSIIALRGCGSINGADPEEADKLLENELIPRIEEKLKQSGKVVVFYDGDEDSPTKPDIGYFAGRLLEHFGNSSDQVTFVAVQKKSWYYPKTEGGNLTNAQDQQFVTYVFEDDKYPGDHNSFSQDEKLVSSPNYEQWYIGASGQIASLQLRDFDKKTPEGEKRKVVLFRVKNNGNLDSEIEAKMEAARIAEDQKKIDKLNTQLAQRKNIYGAHWDNDGKPTIKPEEYPKLEISFVI